MLFKFVKSQKFSCCYVHVKSARKTNAYSHTILLPQTKLPLRLDGQKLIGRDKTINQMSAFTDLYNWQRNNLQEEFVLHDGPPYANGVLHLGHMINKILKDTVTRFQIVQGHKVQYIPGWDCHGLPIELKAITDTNAKLSPVEIRQRARNFAKQTIATQKEAFKSWGVTGDWNNPYTTYSTSYIKNELQQFFNLYNNKLVYRDVKPVYWSPSSKTALAEAELEYNAQHCSKSLFLKLELHDVPEGIPHNSRLFALIWTTTPWSLPSNQAICYNPEVSYSIVKKSEESELLIIATNLVEKLSDKLGSLNVLSTFPGHLLKGATYSHPLKLDSILPFLPGDHATDTKGTGLVHTAPAHGPDDFLIALKNKLPIVSLVDENGCYTNDAGPYLQGLSVLNEGISAVIEKLQNKVVHVENYIHSYPYDWRTKQPIIIRASKQWFIDTDRIKSRAIELLSDVEILPKIHSEIYRKYLISNLGKRPFWCISRQRSWGIPIPVFYDKSGCSIITSESIQHLCELVDIHGPDFWWTLPINQLLPKNILNTNDIQKGNDIFDIWVDSGLSWSNALQKDRIADLYLEGVDQFTGWFQASLITSVALRDKAPYKRIYVHGYAVDSKGLKMSKSLGNVVNPVDVLQGKNGHKVYGIDALRWWVVCHASSDSKAHVSTNILQASSDEVHKIRSTMRFALGALHGYKVQSEDVLSLLLIDKYMLHLLWNYNHEISEYYNNYEFNKIAGTVLKFLTNPVSALYYNAIKDRLYCNAADCSERRAVQFVLLQLFSTIVKSVAPIVPHLAEELYFHLPQKQTESVFQTNFKLDNSWNNQNIASLIENIILNIRSRLHKIIDPNLSNMKVTIGVSEDIFKECDILTTNLELSDIFQVAEVFLTKNQIVDGFDYSLDVEESSLYLCDRCRRVFSKNINEVCERCQNITKELANKTAVTV